MFKQSRRSSTPAQHAFSLHAVRASTMSTLRSPLYILGPLLLLVFAIPLAFFATLTTILAFGALTIRASIIYSELILALIQSWIWPVSTKAAPPKKELSGRYSPPRSRSRRRSNASNMSGSPVDAAPARKLHQSNSSASIVSLYGSGGAARDYEGVGGWRIASNPDEDNIWLGINSRLELPALPPTRNHHRSLTGGSISPISRRWSPVQSRVRTPNHNYYDEHEKHDAGEYFPLYASSNNSRVRISQESRRKSASGSSTSDATSSSGSRRTSVTIKLPGE